MAKDVWVTGYNSNNPGPGSGYGGFMARKGLASATFGADRVAVLDSNVDDYFAPYWENMERVRRSFNKALRTNGKPRFLFNGWQDYGGGDITNYVRDESPGSAPVIISLTSSPESYQHSDVVVEPSYSGSGINNRQTVLMHAVTNMVTPEVLVEKTAQTQRAIPFDTVNEDFMTVMVGNPQYGVYPSRLEAMGETLAERVIKLADEKGLNLLISTSPRTDPSLIYGMQSEIDFYNRSHGDPIKIYLYEHAVDDPMNPYPGVMGLPRNRLVVVTEDSASLASEAVASPVPVALYSPWHQDHNYFKVMLDGFFRKKYIHKLNEMERRSPDQWEAEKIVYNTTLETAKALKQNLLSRGLANVGDFPAVEPVQLERVPYQPLRVPQLVA